MTNNVIAIVNDMIFSEKIRGTANHLNIPVVFVFDEIELFEQLKKTSPSKIIIDLNENSMNPISLIKKLKSDDNFKNIPTIGYLSHFQKELKKEAKDKGFDQVFPRSEFSKNLPDILKTTI